MEDLSKLRDLNKMVDETMRILDEDFQVPENLTDKILSNRSKVNQTKVRKLNFAIYAQVAAVLAAGVFLGVVLGKNAQADMFISKETKKERSLMEYRSSHHLFVDRNQIFDLGKTYHTK